MDVVSPEVNSILPDEIMDSEAMEEDPPAEPRAPSVHPEPELTQVPMETEVPEIVTLCPAATPTQKTDARSTLTTAESTLCRLSPGKQIIVASSSSVGLRTTGTINNTQPSGPLLGQSVTKLSGSLTPTVNHQIIINKVTADGKIPAATLLKPDGQKLLVTGLSKTGQPIVLALPNTWSKPATSQGAAGDSKTPTQFKVVTTGTRTELKPVIGLQTVSTASQLLGSSSPLQGQQLKTLKVGVTTTYILCKKLVNARIGGQNWV